MTQPQATTRPRLSRIQQKNRDTILDAALDVFSANGFRGATLDQIAESAGLSKPNLLYYFRSKEEIHSQLLAKLLENWLAPLHDLRGDGEPVQEILAYVRRKLELARDYPRESRLFANEILLGATRLQGPITDDLRPLVDEKAAIIKAWMDQGRILQADPVHLIMSVWALTQHYADFEVQVHAVLGPDRAPYDEAAAHLDLLFRRMLDPNPQHAMNP